MQRMLDWIKTALIRLGAVAAGAFGALTLLNQLAAERDMPLAVAAETPHADERPATSAVPPGWQPVEQHGLPAPTFWPAAMALAITFLAWGIVTIWLISAFGLVLFVAALAGWIGDILHDH